MQARPQAAELSISSTTGSSTTGSSTTGNTVLPARVGFTVSKKVGNAVARNRAKRRLRAAAEDVLNASAAPGIDYVLIGRQQTLVRPYAALKQDLQAALARLGMLQDQEHAP